MIAMKETSLCPRCKALQLPSLFDGPRYECDEDLADSEDLNVRVGYLSDLRKNVGCRLCCLLANIHNYEVTDYNTEKIEEADNFAARQDPRKIHYNLRLIRADIVINYDASTVANSITTHLLVEFDPSVPTIFYT